MTPERWHQVTGIFHAACARERANRHTFVDDACGTDATLRAAVQAMLDGHDDAGAFGDVPLEAFASGLEEGARVGCYEITASIGAGGMGEVYRAYDTQLSRDVAIKILPRAFAHDPDGLVRLRREARLLASINHPNIAAIYGLEKSGDIDHLILELVEGDNLHGPLPLHAALEYARQVADALEAAHRKGVVHRDSKPANIKVTPEGRVKVLDFGLATALSSVDDHPGSGDVVGSPPYMSPEQARGEAVDQRTDIWAFGCLLFELLSGKRAFPAQTLSGTIRGVLEGEPDWAALPAGLPARIRELLRRCLEKEPAARLQNIAEAATTIERAQRGWNRWRMAAIAAGVAGMAAIGIAVGAHAPRAGSRAEWSQITKFPDSVSQPALSPDGRMVAFVRGPSTFFGPGQIYVKSLPDGEPVQLTHDDFSKMSPAFSPDGARLAYTSVDASFRWDTWTVPTSGGESRRWLTNASGLVWTSARRLVFSEMRQTPHMAVVVADESRTDRRDIYVPAAQHGMAHRSYPSPDGRWVLLAEMDQDHVWMPCRLVSMDGATPGRQVGPSDAACTSGAWTPDGEWMYVTSNAGGVHHIWRQHFPDGAPQQVTSGPTEEQGIAMAPDGRSFVTAVALQTVSIWLHDKNGERQISSLEGIAVNPKFTPDGKRLFYVIVKEMPTLYSAQPGDLWMANVETGASQAVAPGLGVLDYDVSPDGQRIVIGTMDSAKKPRLWLGWVEQQSAPREIPDVQGRQPKFGAGGEIFFRMDGFVYRMQPDGTGLRKALDKPVLLLAAASRDSRWIVGWSALADGAGMAMQASSLDGEEAVQLGSQIGWDWSPAGDSLSISGGPIAEPQRSYLIPLAPGKQVPAIGRRGALSEQELAALPGARRIEAVTVPGPSSDVYAFYRGTWQRNLYRIAVP